MNVVMQPAAKEPGICKFWQFGSCTHNPCSFAHPPEQFGTKASSSNASTKVANVAMQPVKETPVCKYWVNGNCKSNPCTFLHPPDQDGSKLNVTMQSAKEPEVCKYWVKKGKCRGDPCPHLHPPQEPKQQQHFQQQQQQQSPQMMPMIAAKEPEVCVFWKRGSCKKDPCTFRHPADQGSPAKAPLKERTMCTYWLRGYCNREECAHKHHPKESARPDRVERNIVKKVLNKSAFATPENPRKASQQAANTNHNTNNNNHNNTGGFRIAQASAIAANDDNAVFSSPIAKPDFFTSIFPSPTLSLPTAAAAAAAAAAPAVFPKAKWEETQEQEEPEEEEETYAEEDEYYEEGGEQGGEGGEYLEEEDGYYDGYEEAEQVEGGGTASLFEESKAKLGQCEYCGGGHASAKCPVLVESRASAAATAPSINSVGATPFSSAFDGPPPLERVVVPSAFAGPPPLERVVVPSAFAAAGGASSVGAGSISAFAAPRTQEQPVKKRFQVPKDQCEHCGGEHASESCPMQNQEVDNDEEEVEEEEEGAEEPEPVPVATTKKGKRDKQAAKGDKKAAKAKKGPVVVNVKVSNRGVITPAEKMTEDQAQARRNKFGGAVDVTDEQAAARRNRFGVVRDVEKSAASCDICGDRHPSNACPVLGDCGTPNFDDGRGGEAKVAPTTIVRRCFHTTYLLPLLLFFSASFGPL